MSDIVIYTKDTCPYCFAAKSLLKEKRVSFREHEISDDPARRAEMISLSGRRTVPQIFINGEHVGGYDDIAMLDASGRLDKLLNNSTEAVAA